MGGGGRIGRRPVRGRVVILTPDAVTRLNVPERFAPAAENCRIEYGFRRGEAGTRVSMVIRDRDNNEVKRNDLLGFAADRDDVFNWDGKDDSGRYVTPDKSPFSVGIEFFSGFSQAREVKVEVGVIAIWNQDSPKIVMNDPAHKFVSIATVMLKKTDGTDVTCGVPCKVEFSYVDTPPDNTLKTDSFQTSAGVRLGKRAAPPSEVFWEAHADCTAASADGFKEKCKVDIIHAVGADQGKAKIWFKPSGVGGDTFKTKAVIYASDGTTVLFSCESASELSVWRSLHMAAVYTMNGQTYLDTATMVDEIQPAFTPAFVDYTRAAISTLDAGLSVKYIGLYQTGGGMKTWPADLSPTSLETSPNQLQPTAAELAAYAYAGADPVQVAAKATAKTAIEAKAQAWFSAVVADYRQCYTNWFTAAAVPGATNALLAVEYYHPKLSEQADGATNFWPAGISINLANPGSGLDMPGDPDRATWRGVQGFNSGQISVIFKNYPSAEELKITCRHEIGHATKSAFERADFGAGDHSARGLMTFDGEAADFSAPDLRILRGMTP